MTIAACHLSPEGVVFGADSASTLEGGELGPCHFDYAQKVFEVGRSPSSVGLVTWGLGQVGANSHRTIAAELASKHAANPYATLLDMASDLGNMVTQKFQAAYPAHIAEYARLDSLHGPMSINEARSYEFLSGLTGGYCLGGRIGNYGQCEAYVVDWGMGYLSAKVAPIVSEAPMFWGVPQIAERLVHGVDSRIFSAIASSPHWTGTEKELLDLVAKNGLIVPNLLPIREAVDWVHTVIHTTIRGAKFAKWPHWCGGPVEIAVVTTDRDFRWVRHKSLDAAIVTAGD